MRPRQLLLAALLVVSACATVGGPRHVATVSVVSAHAVLSAVQDTERALVCGAATAPAAPACIPDEVHRKVSADLATAFQYDIDVHNLVRAAPTDTSLPATVPALLGKIAAILDQVVAALPTSTQKQALVAQIGGPDGK